jgi:hypothetical protein
MPLARSGQRGPEPIGGNDAGMSNPSGLLGRLPGASSCNDRQDANTSTSSSIRTKENALGKPACSC